MHDQTPAIETSGLTRRFGSVTAVDGVTLTIARGEIFGLLGHNGAGKTTTIRLLNGILAADAGDARVLGLSPATDGAAVRARTGVLTETPSLDERLTAVQNLTTYAELYGVPVAEVGQRVQALLRLFDLEERGKEKVGGYSKGMKQRLALARALLHDPDLIFLDEPTAALDPVATRQVHELVHLLSRERGHTIVLCTHNLVEAQALCNRVGIMEHGRLVAVGAPAELARQLGWAAQLDLEVDAAHETAARQLIAAYPQLTVDVQPDGRLRVGNVARAEIPDLLAALLNAGVAVYSVTPQQPSLAEVYFAIHANENNKEQAR